MKLIKNKKANGLDNNEFFEYLKTPVERCEFTQEEADELRKTLEQGMIEYPGLGISATQLGIKKRACLIKFRDQELFLLNPKVKEKSKEGFIFYEACLSIPKSIDSFVKTIRPCKVVIETDNLGELTFEINSDGDKEQVSTETMMTVIVQHEIDHLDGITILDRVYSTTIEKERTFGRNEKVVMKSPDGEFVEVKYKKANEYYLKGYELV